MALEIANSQLTLKWASELTDGSGVPATPTIADLDADGYPEVIAIGMYNYIYILDGQTGTTLVKIPHHSTTFREEAVLVDVDMDGQVDIIAIEEPTGPPSNTLATLSVYSCPDWAPARGIWNEQQYHVTNVNDDGTIPQFEKEPWKYNVGWLQQARDADVEHPSTVGNTLMGMKVLPDVALSWIQVGAREYLIYREIVKGVWGLPYLTISNPTFTFVGDVGGPPDLYFYQTRSADCVGSEEMTE